jgi:hypothetical protein
MASQRPAAGSSGVEVYPLPIDDEAVSADGGVEEGASRRLGRQGQVKCSIIHDVGDRLLRCIGELSPISRDHLHPIKGAYDGFRGEGKFLEGIDVDDACTKHLIGCGLVLLEHESFEPS